MLGLLCQTYLAPGDEAIFTEHGFLVYKIYIQAAGATPVSVKETDERADVDAILAAVTPKTKIVFLANPNNPTGTYVPFEEIRRLHAGLPKNVLLVLDAAYAEYVRRNDYEAGIELVVGARERGHDPHLLEDPRAWRRCASAGCMRRRTSSTRSTACAGRSTSTRAAIEAGVAAIRDRAHVERSVAHNEIWLRLADRGARPGSACG